MRLSSHSIDINKKKESYFLALLLKNLIIRSVGNIRIKNAVIPPDSTGSIKDVEDGFPSVAKVCVSVTPTGPCIKNTVYPTMHPTITLVLFWIVFSFATVSVMLHMCIPIIASSIGIIIISSIFLLLYFYS